MMRIQEDVPLRSKTTMKIGGSARYYAELKTKSDVEEAYKFAKEKNVPLILLGAGSNTIFADGTVEALIAKVAAEAVTIENTTITVEAGKYLAVLINELAEKDLDLSPLTGIPGTIGGAIFGNAGQGFGGMWIGSYVESVEVFEIRGKRKEERGKWTVYSKKDCEFGYRTSAFKKLSTFHFPLSTPLIWSATLRIPSRPKEEIKTEVERLLKKRIETQPHIKTAGSCFLSVSKESPAWKLIDQAGLRGHRIGDIEVSPKHANFLINAGSATYEDAKKLVEYIQSKTSDPLHVEMRFIEENGRFAYEEEQQSHDTSCTLR